MFITYSRRKSPSRCRSQNFGRERNAKTSQRTFLSQGTHSSYGTEHWNRITESHARTKRSTADGSRFLENELVELYEDRKVVVHSPFWRHWVICKMLSMIENAVRLFTSQHVELIKRREFSYSETSEKPKSIPLFTAARHKHYSTKNDLI